jgi:hypothetical protein
MLPSLWSLATDSVDEAEEHMAIDIQGRLDKHKGRAAGKDRPYLSIAIVGFASYLIYGLRYFVSEERLGNAG